MIELFHTILSEPIYNLLVLLYDFFPIRDIGIAIILLTVIIKVVLWPLTGKSLKGQKALQSIQPKIEELKKRLKDDKEKMAKEMMELYKEEKVSPASSCLPLLIQLPILIALYRVLLVGLSNGTKFQLYSFVPDPGMIDPIMFGFIDLSVPSIPIAIIAGIFQYFQARMMQTRRPPKNLQNKEGAKDENMMAAMNKSMLYFMPAVTVLIGASFPGGLAVYWVVITLLSILQQHMIFSKEKKEEAAAKVEA